MRYRSLLGLTLTVAGLMPLSRAVLAQDCTTAPLVESLPSGNEGGFGVLELATDGVPLVGNPFELRVAGGAPGAPGCVVYGIQESLLVLPGLEGAFHPALPGIEIAFDLDGSGTAEGLLSHPSLPAEQCGVTFIAQAFTLDSTSPGGVGLSNALRIRIGDVFAPRFVYVDDWGDSIFAYLTDSNGVPVAEHPGSPFSSGSTSYAPDTAHDTRDSMIEIDGVLYTANQHSHDVSALRIEADGSLTPITGSPFPAGGYRPRSLAAHPSGDWLYVANDTNGTLGILAIAPDGSLSEAFPSVVTGWNGMMNIRMHPSGQVLWTSWRVHNVSAYYNQPLRAFAIGADGNATLLGSFGVPRPYANMAVTPSGEHFYAVTGIGGTSLTSPMGVFGFDVPLPPTLDFPSIDGSPFFNSPEPVDVTQDLAMGADGEFLFVYNRASQYNPDSIPHIHTYAVGESGALTSAGVTDVSGTWGANILEVSDDGTRLYTVGQRAEVYAIDDNGGLTHLGTSPTLSGIGITVPEGVVLVQ